MRTYGRNLRSWHCHLELVDVLEYLRIRLEAPYVAVMPKQDVKAIDIRPRSRRILPALEDNVIRFTLSEPGNFIAEINFR